MSNPPTEVDSGASIGDVLVRPDGGIVVLRHQVGGPCVALCLVDDRGGEAYLDVRDYETVGSVVPSLWEFRLRTVWFTREPDDEEERRT